MGFAHQTDRIRPCVHHRRKYIIILRRHAVALGHAKGRHLRPRRGRGIEKSTIRRVRPRPAGFDIINAQSVERSGNRHLFRGRKLHPLGLLPVAQRGVVKVKAFAGHRSDPSFILPDKLRGA